MTREQTLERDVALLVMEWPTAGTDAKGIDKYSHMPGRIREFHPLENDTDCMLAWDTFVNKLGGVLAQEDYNRLALIMSSCAASLRRYSLCEMMVKAMAKKLLNEAAGGRSR